MRVIRNFNAANVIDIHVHTHLHMHKALLSFFVKKHYYALGGFSNIILLECFYRKNRN